MSSVYFDPAVGGDGSTVTDDSSPTTGLANGGHRALFVPALSNIVSVGNFALTKSNAASASAALAQSWAVQLGTPVSGGEYSAKYHAQSAAGSAGSASTSAATASNWAVQLGTPVSGGEYSAKYHAQSSASSATLASNWAVQLGSPVSGGEYSAKYHAQAAAASAAAAASSAGSLVMPTITAADAGRGIKVNGTGNGWSLDLRVLYVGYDNRADLRSMSPSAGDLALVDGLGLFRYLSGADDGPDDDETAFATASGYWLLICPSWDVIDAYTLMRNSQQDDRLAAAESSLAKTVRATSTQSAFALSVNSSTTFNVAVAGAALGASVIVTAPSDPTLNTITLFGRVSAANTVTVYIGNSHASSTGGFGAGDWQVTAINK